VPQPRTFPLTARGMEVLAGTRMRPENSLMRANPRILSAVVIASAVFAVTPAWSQVIVETRIRSSPKGRDLSAIFHKPSDPTASKPKTTAVRLTAAAPARPRVLPDSFSGETEDTLEPSASPGGGIVHKLVGRNIHSIPAVRVHDEDLALTVAIADEANL